MKKLVLLVDKVPVVRGQWQVDAYIGLAQHTKDAEGRILLSPDCRTATEIHAWADALIKELQQIKRRASKLRWDNHPASGAKRRHSR